MSAERSFFMPLPLDDDGFLRRECPNCEREFMALYRDDGADETPPGPGGYYCPYCGLQAGPDDWWTKDQLAQATSVVVNEMVDPMLRDFGRDLERSGGGFIKVQTKISTEEPTPALTETNDMLRIDFACHAADPVKVLARWDHAVCCMVCGTLAS